MLATTHIVSPTASPNLPESKSSTSSSGTSTTTSVITQQTTSSGQQGSESHSLEHEKKAICRHPLFPLMALLFEKCERATQTPDCPAGDNFDVDIQAFVQHQEKDRNPFFSDDTELDSLMVKAIQVLRIHLLELEKVNELCKDFCNRYITCLKSKMQSEHLLRTEVHSPTPNFDGSMSSSSGSNSGNVTPSLSTSSSQLTPTTTGPSSAPGTTGITTTTSSSSSGGGGGGGGGGGSRSSTSNHHHHSTSTTSTTTTTTTTNNNSLAAAAAAAVSLQGQLQMQQQVVASMAANNVLIQQGLAAAAAQPAALSMGSLGQGQIVSGGTVYQMVQTPQGIVAQPIQIRTASLPNQVASGSPLIHGSTPLSQIGVVGTPNIIGQIPVTSAPPTPASTQITPMGNLAQLGSDDEDMICKRKTKRGILPKTATKIMRSWLFQNIVHPYPSEDEKRQIAAQTNLTLLQVNNWFINARRRILQPMLDASNPDQAKVKKNKPPNRPLQRFWPENIANLRPQIPTSLDGNLSGSSSPLSIGDADGIGDGASNESSPLATSSQPSNQTIVLPNMETATFVLNDGHIVNASASLDKFRLDHIAGHASLANISEASRFIHNSNINASTIMTTTTTATTTAITTSSIIISNNNNNTTTTATTTAPTTGRGGNSGLSSHSIDNSSSSSNSSCSSSSNSAGVKAGTTTHRTNKEIDQNNRGKDLTACSSSSSNSSSSNCGSGIDAIREQTVCLTDNNLQDSPLLQQ